jgi:hypothetical protein
VLERDWLIVLALGGAFILLGLGAYFWGRSEEKSYFNAISSRADVREYLNHWPPRPEAGALKIGGWIAIAIGIMLAVAGGIMYLVG